MLKNSLIAIMLAAPSAALAQGAFDFSRIPGLGSEATVQIDLGPEMLGFVVEAARQTDPNAAQALAGIRRVSVRAYEDLAETAPLVQAIDETSRILEADGWQRLVYINDGDDKVRLYVRLGGNELTGMTVMVVDESDAVFVNVDGTINPATLGQIANQFGVGGVLDDITGLDVLGATASATGDRDADADRD